MRRSKSWSVSCLGGSGERSFEFEDAEDVGLLGVGLERLSTSLVLLTSLVKLSCDEQQLPSSEKNSETTGFARERFPARRSLRKIGMLAELLLEAVVEEERMSFFLGVGVFCDGGRPAGAGGGGLAGDDALF